MVYVLPALSAHVGTTAHSAELRQVGTAFEALLLEQCLAPMAPKNDAVAGYGINLLAQAIAARLGRERLP